MIIVLFFMIVILKFTIIILKFMINGKFSGNSFLIRRIRLKRLKIYKINLDFMNVNKLLIANGHLIDK